QGVHADCFGSLRWIAGLAAFELTQNELQGGRSLSIGGPPRQGEPKAALDPVLRSRAAFGHKPPTKIGCAIAEERVVEQRQRLPRDRRAAAPSTTDRRVRPIERLHERVLHDPLMKHVNRSATSLAAFYDVFGVGVFRVPRQNCLGWDWRLERW